jgi:hypothetical protein
MIQHFVGSKAGVLSTDSIGATRNVFTLCAAYRTNNPAFPSGGKSSRHREQPNDETTLVHLSAPGPPLLYRKSFTGFIYNRVSATD